MIAILGSLPLELQGLLKVVVVKRSLQHNGCRIYEGTYQGQPILLASTGMGRERAEAAAEFISSIYPLKAMVSMGFGGGLAKDLRVGDIVVCATVYYHDGEATLEEMLHGGRHCSEGLVKQAAKVQGGKDFRLIQGRGLTVLGVLSSPAAKEEAGKRFPVQVVDMESYWVANTARQKGIPFLAIRSISDTVAEELPKLDGVISPTGTWNIKRAGSYFARHPGQVVRVIQLRWNAWRAARALAAFLRSFLANWDIPEAGGET